MATSLTFNPDAWSIGDLDDFEQLTGKTLDEALRAASVKDSAGEVEVDKRGRPMKRVRLDAKTLLGIVWIESRMTDPSFTLEDARKVRFGDLELVMGEQDPTPASGDGSGS